MSLAWLHLQLGFHKLPTLGTFFIEPFRRGVAREACDGGSWNESHLAPVATADESKWRVESVLLRASLILQT